jgi:hypothetical protein
MYGRRCLARHIAGHEHAHIETLAPGQLPHLSHPHIIISYPFPLRQQRGHMSTRAEADGWGQQCPTANLSHIIPRVVSGSQDMKSVLLVSHPVRTAGKRTTRQGSQARDAAPRPPPTQRHSPAPGAPTTRAPPYYLVAAARRNAMQRNFRASTIGC